MKKTLDGEPKYIKLFKNSVKFKLVFHTIITERIHTMLYKTTLIDRQAEKKIDQFISKKIIYVVIVVVVVIIIAV